MLEWHEMTPIEKASCIYWDAYKDAYGFRPRHVDTTEWSLEEFHKEINFLDKVIFQNEKDRRASELDAADKVEVIAEILQESQE
jgi:hypothetical protein